ncbi:hypothetical protein [Sphingomonas sp. PB4P5]|uniref:hypothetical protein n=1 Tax=Parasphingomonas puruogangriensis TaxID=3096155 RepID=UPI002FCB390F
MTRDILTIALILALWLTASVALALILGRAIALHAHPLDDAEQDGAEGQGWGSSFHHKDMGK